jgi:ribulose kinase
MLTIGSTDWMNEGGQSSTGQLLDFMLETHPAWNKLLSISKDKGVNHFVYLGELLDELVKEQKAPFLTYLTKDLHIYPDLHGEFTSCYRSKARLTSIREQATDHLWRITA